MHKNIDLSRSLMKFVECAEQWNNKRSLVHKKAKWLRWNSKANHLTPINTEHNIGNSIVQYGNWFSVFFIIFFFFSLFVLLELPGNYYKQTFVLLCFIFFQRQTQYVIRLSLEHRWAWYRLHQWLFSSVSTIQCFSYALWMYKSKSC